MVEDVGTPGERKRRVQGGSIGAGVALILVGVFFLLVSAGVVRPAGNWWAIFILVPVVVLLMTAWRRYRVTGRFAPSVAWTLSSALYPLAVALIFLLNLDWGVVWPVFPIIAGLAMLMAGVAQR